MITIKNGCERLADVFLLCAAFLVRSAGGDGSLNASVRLIVNASYRVGNFWFIFQFSGLFHKAPRKYAELPGPQITNMH